MHTRLVMIGVVAKKCGVDVLLAPNSMGTV